MMQQFFLYREKDRASAIESIVDCLHSLDPKRFWLIEVKEYKRPRTDLQNRALWGVAYKTLQEATGNDPEDLHQYFLGERYGWDTIVVLGRKRLVPKKRSSKLSTSEFADFYNFIQQRSAQAGYYIPDPDPNWFIHDDEDTSVSTA